MPGAGGRVGPGAQFRIVEAFGRDPDFYIDIVDTVTRLDETGITLVGRAMGQVVSQLKHDFTATAAGTEYVSTLTIGIATPGLRSVINPLVHRTVFSEAMGRAWLRHNVEEVGLLEHIIPLLHPA